MRQNIFRSGGIPAIACLPDGRASCVCSFVARLNESSRQANIELRFDIHLDKFPGKQHVNLVYDGDSLVPGTAGVRPLDALPPPFQVEDIASNNKHDFKRLSLMLSKPCNVHCPVSVGSLAPDAKDVDNFHQIASLARTLQVDILFDQYRVNPDQLVRFWSLVKPTTLLSAIPLGDAQTRFRVAGWEVFCPAQEAEAEASDAPPPYAEASRKRIRQPPSGSPSGSPQALPAKRVFVDYEYLDRGSPTEKATTTTATSSPRPVPSTPLAGDGFQEAVDAAVAKMLPDAVQKLLPSTIAQLFAPPPSLSSTSRPQPRQRPRTPVPLRNVLWEQLDEHADGLTEHANGLIAEMQSTFQDQLDEQRAEYGMLKEDNTLEMTTECDEKLAQFKQQVAELVDYAEEEATRRCSDVQDNVLEWKQALMKHAFKLAAILRSERSHQHQAPRAESVPVGAGW
ncbi:hypothetical protein K491DRAFT_699701 [Lophiostoma macrostomum CBS 122681]|uniref:Uncharacterized protein n=1 Tax=Lophiostoma macrostomum CBS 122681 TaxID=1314788 RepID=A0A6A6SJZ7_9PLEO|nr:hypothetical protein K491DRAFT_699701 [Lophiostoma macrostomum CBS 122681]